MEGALSTEPSSSMPSAKKYGIPAVSLPLEFQSSLSCPSQFSDVQGTQYGSYCCSFNYKTRLGTCSYLQVLVLILVVKLPPKEVWNVELGLRNVDIATSSQLKTVFRLLYKLSRLSKGHRMTCYVLDICIRAFCQMSQMVEMVKNGSGGVDQTIQPLRVRCTIFTDDIQIQFTAREPFYRGQQLS